MDSRQNAGKQPQALHYEIIFVVSYGRSGSTLLQGILNSIDGVLIKGENGNIIRHFYSAYQELLLNQERHPQANLPIHPWYGSCWLDKDQYLKDVRQLATNLLLNQPTIDRSSIRALGFKEIRYATMEDPLAYLQFLQELFPSSCIIHLTRNHRDVAQSQLRKFKVQQFAPSVIEAELQKFDELMSNYGHGRTNYFRLDFRDLINPDLLVLEKLYSFLGAEFSPSTIKSEMQIRHSY